MTPQELMDMDGAGSARKQLIEDGMWGDIDFDASEDSPVVLKIRFSRGFSISDYNDILEVRVDT